MEQAYSCPNCNLPVEYGQPSCADCGMALDWGDAICEYSDTLSPPDVTGYAQNSYTCPECGNEVYYGELSCNSCGCPFFWEEPSVVPQYEAYQNYPEPLPQQYEDQTSIPAYSGYNQYPPPVSRMQYRRNKPKTTIFTRQLFSKQLLSIIGVIVFLVAGASVLAATNGFSSNGRSQSTNSTASGPDWQPNTQPLIRSFIASPTEVLTGRPSTLSWDVAGADSISIDNNIGSVQAKGSLNITPAATSKYVITASNNFGSSSTSTLITVNPVPPVINSFAASPSSITAGQSANLQWNVTGATSVTINQGIGPVTISGSKAVSPVSTITYVLTASNTAGTKTASTQVTVSALGAPTINSFTATPDTIIAGQSATLTWSVAGATSVNLDQGIGDVSTNTTYVVMPATTTTYTLAAVNSAGGKTAKITVTVTAASALAVTKFESLSSPIAPGGFSTLAWNVTGATSVVISPDVGTVSPSGTCRVSPSTNTTYVLTASNSTNTVTASAVVTIDPSLLSPPIINSFTASAVGVSAGTDITVPPGTQVTLLFTAANDVINASISPDIGTMDYNRVTIIATQTKTYTLTVTNNYGSATATVTVNVQ